MGVVPAILEVGLGRFDNEVLKTFDGPAHLVLVRLSKPLVDEKGGYWYRS
jgi:hypothetical protein